MSITDLRWWEQAACTTAPASVKTTFVIGDTSRYHRSQSRRVEEQLQDTVNARAVCAGCPVAAACLQALWDDQHAVAGGTVPAERVGRRPERQEAAS